jgi:tetratricopeptide (TPR) repeat protein
MAHQNLGQVFLLRGDNEAAIAEFDQALADYNYQTPHMAHFNKGRAYSGLGHWPEAVNSFRAALNIVPAFEGAWYLMGIALEKQNRLLEAEKAFRSAISILPDSSPSHYQLGLILFRQKKMAEARAEFQRVVDLDPEGEMGRNAARYLSILK